MGGWKNLITGTVGSHAYGLATETSDVDTLIVAVAPSKDFLGLNPPTAKAASRVSTNPDITTHELGKFVSLCLAANPTVTELLWLPDDCYRQLDYCGESLIDIRRYLLGARAVRSAYLGYATSQFTKLRARQGESFSSDTRTRTAKHARHLLRLTQQCQDLYLDGHLNVRVDDPQRYHDFGQLVATKPEEGLELAEKHLATVAAALDSRKSALPQEPSREIAQDTVLAIRLRELDGLL